MRRGRRPKWMINVAEERVNILFNRAQEELNLNQDRSNRYVQMALEIAKKYNLKIDTTWNRRYCKNCHKFLQPGVNCQVRLKNSRVEIKCQECGEIRRMPYTREKKVKRRRKIEFHTIKKGNNE